MKTRYGLLGERLGHSYSPPIHNALGNYDYSLVELPPSEVEEFMLKHNFDGINVTIPYKQTVMPFLDHISDRAKKIGSVNTVINKNGKLYGDNTDYYGFLYMANSVGISFKNKKVIILGGGGTSLTAQAVTRDEGAREIVVISRSGKDNYENLHLHKDAEIIVNCTPVGMFPNIEDKPISLEYFENCVGVIDVIYNPQRSALLIEAKKRGIAYVNGMSMLVAQAKLAHELFFDLVVDDGKIERIKNKIEFEKKNIIFVGMPGSGKSTLSQLLAKELGREAVDTDEMVVENEGRAIPDIFATEGEEYFRKAEAQAVKRACRMQGKVIATGGGAVLSACNRREMLHNSLVIWLKRPLSQLPCDGRPLSSPNNDRMRRMYEIRMPLYQEVCDAAIDVLPDPASNIKAIIASLF